MFALRAFRLGLSTSIRLDAGKEIQSVKSDLSILQSKLKANVLPLEGRIILFLLSLFTFFPLFQNNFSNVSRQNW